jgi:hypothetical protein
MTGQVIRRGFAAAQARSSDRKHQVTDDDDDESRFWEASWELMDLAEAHWTIRA